MATDPSRSSSGSTDVKAEAKEKAAELKDQASDLKDQAQDEAEDRLAEGKAKATGVLDDVAGALHDTGDALRDRDRDAFARYADAAADQVDQFTRSIRDRNVGEILDEAERFARRDPGLFLGGAFVLGIFGARFLKASAPGRTGGSRSGRPASYDPDEAPYRLRHTAGGEMPDPSRRSASASPTPAVGPSNTAS
jgi:hypothetical protein